ncbi:peroxidase 40-like [Papaver somniferum]|uniref:peroxidase 40-like n=1 Tax=Papaver somniferum TaxID=3469 RepID=UPI000E6FEB69|nr:peroxidase 40-like [Papaver somniferum]
MAVFNLLVLLWVFLSIASISNNYFFIQACFSTDNGAASSLQIDAYIHTCPDVERIIYSKVEEAVMNDPRMAASLLRLHFHDCFVNGCDASVLLDDSNTFVGEKTAVPNLNSLRGFDVVDAIKCELESVCPETVSCADILATAARDSVVVSGGPGWDVPMGRKDSLSASKTDANNNIPAPNSDLNTLITKFQNVGLDYTDMVALSGAHTIGQARCSSFSSSLQGRSSSSSSDGPVLDLQFLASLKQLCSNSENDNNATLTALDLATPATFDNQYFINLVSGEALLPSDQALVAGNSPTLEIVESYVIDPLAFFEDFKRSMARMGSLSPLTGENGQIRRNCRVAN